jgi:RNA-directed DNA polymerase
LKELFNYINSYIKKINKRKLKPISNINKLYYFAYFCDDKFDTFEIPKANGGKRSIYTTKYTIHKIILKAVNEFLYDKSKSIFPRYVHGYVKGKNVITNAKVHVNKNYIFKIDIKDFFPSIHKGKIIWALKNYLNLNNDVAFLIASLATIKINEKEFLPQGFPTSPILSNLVLKRVDKRFIGLTKKYKIKYTRYADDITFSSNKNIFDEKFINEIENILKKDGFKINYEKVKLLKKGYRQSVTGLVVNEKLNVKREYIKILRTLLFYIEKNIKQYGEKEGIKKAQILFEKKTNSNKNLLKVIEGKLAYLKNVKGEEDSTYKKLKERYENFFSKNKNNKCKSHNPKKVAEILNKFSTDEELKYVLHKWGGNNEFTYDEFIVKVKNKWKNYQKELLDLNVKLNSKIYRFLLDPKPDWGYNNIKYGWSSENLIKCFKNKKEPFDCELNDGSGKKFGNVVDSFKKEIRLEEHGLYNLIDKFIRKYNLNLENTKENNEELKKLFNMKEIYIDTQHLRIGLERLFCNIKQHGQTNKISLQFEETNSYYVLYIINSDSNTNKSCKELIGGDFSLVKESFCSLVEWSIIRKINNKIFECNIFKGEDKEIDFNFKGFTHKIIMYKRVYK